LIARAPIAPPRLEPPGPGGLRRHG